MKWNHSTVPPTAWKIEDGEVVMVDPRDVHLCSGCGKWFFKYPTSTRLLCSVGCELRSAELKAKANLGSQKDV